MIYSEIYGAYYEAVQKILNMARERPITNKDVYNISREYAFQDSGWTISDKLVQGNWALLNADKMTPLDNLPANRPTTILEKRWLKSLLQDPRIVLFDIDTSELENIEPLFNVNNITFFDRRTDGDHYDNPEYIENFKKIRKAIEIHSRVTFRYLTQTNRTISVICTPIRLEYSLKTDKFQLIAVWNSGEAANFNISAIKDVTLLERSDSLPEPVFHMSEAVMELEDRNGALNRCMIEFSDFEKETTKMSDNRYLIKLQFRKEEELELIIRILGFGQFVRVISPESMKKEIAERVSKQLTLMENNFN